MSVCDELPRAKWMVGTDAMFHPIRRGRVEVFQAFWRTIASWLPGLETIVADTVNSVGITVDYLTPHAAHNVIL